MADPNKMLGLTLQEIRDMAKALSGKPSVTAAQVANQMNQAMANMAKYGSHTFGGLQTDPEPKPKPPLPKVKSTQELIGYRFWSIEKGRLISLVHTEKWPIRSYLERKCNNDCQVSGWASIIETNGRNCHWPESSYCGIYAYNSIQSMLEDIASSSWWGKHGLTRKVFGVVKMWGTVLECEKGYKAQYAEPQELYSLEDLDPLEIMELEENHATVYPIDSFEGGLAVKLKGAAHSSASYLEEKRVMVNSLMPSTSCLPQIPWTSYYFSIK